MSVDIVVQWLVAACVPAVNLYPFFYAFRPWRLTPQGRALMIKALGNVVIVDMSVLFAWLGDYPFRDVVRLTGWSLFAVGIWYLLASLLTSPGAERFPPFTWARSLRRGLSRTR